MPPAIFITAATEHAVSVSTFIPAGIGFALFLTLGIVVWSYRDVANRQAKKSSDNSHDSHGTGH